MTLFLSGVATTSHLPMATSCLGKLESTFHLAEWSAGVSTYGDGAWETRLRVFENKIFSYVQRYMQD